MCRYTDFDMTRNRIDLYKSGTTKNQSRPDFLCHLRGAPGLREEEKRDITQLEEARGELICKFESWSPMFYGELPLVLGYATGGLRIKYVTNLYCVPLRLKSYVPVCSIYLDVLHYPEAPMSVRTYLYT